MYDTQEVTSFVSFFNVDQMKTLNKYFLVHFMENLSLAYW